MKRVIIVHGFGGWPNGGWRAWLMVELDKLETYGCAIPLPDENNPDPKKWVEAIEYHVNMYREDDVYLVGHSLGSTAILRYMEAKKAKLAGVVLVSAPIESVENKKITNFLSNPFDFKKIKKGAKQFLIIHGADDQRVSVSQAIKLAHNLGVSPQLIKNGGHLTGSEGWKELPQVLEGLINMFKIATK